MTCKHCAHSEQRMLAKLVLLCVIKGAPAVKVCAKWMREPGSDDE